MQPLLVDSFSTLSFTHGLVQELSLWASKVEQRKGTLNPYFGIYSGDVAKMYIFEVQSSTVQLHVPVSCA